MSCYIHYLFEKKSPIFLYIPKIKRIPIKTGNTEKLIMKIFNKG